MVNQYVDDIVTVSEDEIAAAILALLEKQKVIAEGAGAVSTAAVLFDKLPVRGKKVVSIVSGGNIDVNILSRVITRGLVTSGRNVNLTIALTDKPGSFRMCRKSSPPAEEMWLRCITTVRMRIWRSPAAI